MRKYIRDYNFSTPQMLLENLSDYLQEFYDDHKILDGGPIGAKRLTTEDIGGPRWYIMDGYRDDNANRNVESPSILIQNCDKNDCRINFEGTNIFENLFDRRKPECKIPYIEKRMNCQVVVDPLDVDYNEINPSRIVLGEVVWAIKISLKPTLSMYKKMISLAVTHEDKKEWIKFILFSTTVNKDIKTLLLPYSDIIDQLKSENKKLRRGLYPGKNNI